MQGLFKNPLVLALLASVLLNGVLIGKSLSPKPDQAEGPDTRPNIQAPGPQSRGRLENLPRYLTPEQRERFDTAAKASGQKNVREAFKDMRRAHRTVGETLRAEPFDSAALRAATADVREKSTALASASDESIAAFLDSATPEERAEILTAMRMGERKGRKGERGGQKGERKGPVGDRR